MQVHSTNGCSDQPELICSKLTGRIFFQVFHVGAEAQAIGPASAAFPRPEARSWITNAATGMPTTSGRGRIDVTFRKMWFVRGDTKKGGKKIAVGVKAILQHRGKNLIIKNILTKSTH